MRIDLYLAGKGLAESRSRAQAMISGGMVLLNGRTVTKPSAQVGELDCVTVTDTLKFVSRGGEKLLSALERFSLSVEGLTCVDIGASTGGFTDCLLKRGAKKVYAVDCGTDQLHPSLREDPRVIPMEKTNARALTAEALGERCRLAVMDVSFISQTLMYKAVTDTLTENGILISLIKPQFEVTAKALGGGGILRDRREHQHVIKNVAAKAAEHGLTLTAIAPSPITGGDGNREYLACFTRGGGKGINLTAELLSELTSSDKNR